MGNSYVVYDQQGVYFVTFTVHQWVDVFTRDIYRNIFVDSIKFCQENKGLEVFSWVLMSNHSHLIISSKKEALSDIIRDLKKFTAKKIIDTIKNNDSESRKEWLIWLLQKDEHIWFWEEGYHGVEITSKSFYNSKMDYIHYNPVKAGLVEKEEEYLWSSCRDIYGTSKGKIVLSEY